MALGIFDWSPIKLFRLWQKSLFGVRASFGFLHHQPLATLESQRVRVLNHLGGGGHPPGLELGLVYDLVAFLFLSSVKLLILMRLTPKVGGQSAELGVVVEAPNRLTQQSIRKVNRVTPGWHPLAQLGFLLRRRTTQEARTPILARTPGRNIDPRPDEWGSNTLFIIM